MTHKFYRENDLLVDAVRLLETQPDHTFSNSGTTRLDLLTKTLNAPQDEDPFDLLIMGEWWNKLSRLHGKHDVHFHQYAGIAAHNPSVVTLLLPVHLLGRLTETAYGLPTLFLGLAFFEKLLEKDFSEVKDRVIAMPDTHTLQRNKRAYVEMLLCNTGVFHLFSVDNICHLENATTVQWNL